jgi:hypothetical protein
MFLQDAATLVFAHMDLFFFQCRTDSTDTIASIMRPKKRLLFSLHLLVVCSAVLRRQGLVISASAYLHYLAQHLNGIVIFLFFNKPATLRY